MLESTQFQVLQEQVASKSVIETETICSNLRTLRHDQNKTRVDVARNNFGCSLFFLGLMTRTLEMQKTFYYYRIDHKRLRLVSSLITLMLIAGTGIVTIVDDLASSFLL